MRLVLADGSSAWETIFRTEDDQPAYKTEVIAKNKFSGSSTTVVHKIPLGQGAKVSSEQSMGSLFNLRTSELAQIKIRAMHSDEFTINGKFIDTSDFFRKEGFGWYGRDRLWTGPDGREYRWEMGDSKPELFLNDEAETLVAKFHREHSGFLGFHEACPPSLEIFGEVTEELLDMIIITYVYMEKTRAEREEVNDAVAKQNLKMQIKAAS